LKFRSDQEGENKGIVSKAKIVAIEVPVIIEVSRVIVKGSDPKAPALGGF
jgi:hypothetical protein